MGFRAAGHAYAARVRGRQVTLEEMLAPQWDVRESATLRQPCANASETVLLVSMTSVPSRATSMAAAVERLALQTRPPEETLLVLPRGLWDVPANWSGWQQEEGARPLLPRARPTVGLVPEAEPLKAVSQLHGVRIVRPARDHGPVMKLVGALLYLRTLPRERREAAVLVTLDDDMIYPRWVCENLLNWAVRFPDSAVAHTGTNYMGLPKSEIDYVSKGQTYMRMAGAYPGGRHIPPDPCTMRPINYLLSWSGVAYRASFFEHNSFLSDLDRFLKLCTWCDDQYVSGKLNAAGVRIFVAPFSHPSASNWKITDVAKKTAARAGLKNKTLLMVETARILLQFQGSGAAAWKLRNERVCTGTYSPVSRDFTRCDATRTASLLQGSKCHPIGLQDRQCVLDPALESQLKGRRNVRRHMWV